MLLSSREAAIGIGTLLLVVAAGVDRQKLAVAAPAFFVLSIVSLVGSLRMMGGYRYMYAPAMVLAFICVAGAGSQASVATRCVAILMILLALQSWAPGYRAHLAPWVVEGGPLWAAEVGAWRRDPATVLRIQPQWKEMPWSVRLDKP